MSRWIDVDALYDFMNRANTPYNALIQEAVEIQPSISIVRCKDCKYKGKVGDLIVCRIHEISTRADDYCSRGERSEDE